MKRCLELVKNGLFHYKNSERIEGKNNQMKGDCSELTGDLHNCEITEEEREKGINIKDLTKEKKEVGE